MRSCKTVRMAGALLLVSACALDSPRDGEGEDRGFYEGKMLEIIVPFGPGGGSDTWARLIAPHLQQELKGGVVQVMNIPGASGIGGANEFALRRKHDGTSTLVSSATQVLSYLIGEPVVRYDFRKFSAVLASPAGGVVFVSPELGVTKGADLPRARVPITYGGISPTGTDIIMLVTFELLGLDVKTIMGYNSRGGTRMAFEQGETNIEFQIMQPYLINIAPLVEKGKAVPLFTFGILDEQGNVVRDPSQPELPTIREVYQDIHQREPSGPAWEAYKAALAAGLAVLKVLWVHEDAPPEAIETLRQAAAEITADTAFLELARQEVGEYPFYIGEAAEQRFMLATTISPEALRWLRTFLVEKHAVDWLRPLLGAS